MNINFPAIRPAFPAAVLLAALGVLTLTGPAFSAPAVNPNTVAPETDTWNQVTAPVISTVRPPAVNPWSPGAMAMPVPSGSPSLEQAIQGRIIGSFHAENLDLRDALALFADQNNLNIVPDNDISGTVTLNVHNLPLNQMMSALLEAGDCCWAEDEGLIRVRNTETRTFVVDYLRLKRAGMGASSATLNSATSGGSSGGSSGGGGGGGGSSSSSSVNLTADNPTDFWTELRTELDSLLTEAGKASLAINKTAGIIEVTDRPSALKKVETYLSATEQNINRQVDIETKIYDVTLNDSSQFGIDWVHVANAYAGSLAFGSSTFPSPIGSLSSQLSSSALSGLTTTPTGTASGPGTTANAVNGTLSFENMNTEAAITALKTQGNVEVVAAPRIRTLNNQTALVKVGEELPFFTATTQNSQSAGGNLQTSGESVTTITVGTILSITPQISEDGYITMDISPVLTSEKGIESSGGTSPTTAPDLDTKQVSTLVRVRNGTTVVLGGLIQSEKDQNDNKVPVLGDIPLLGKLFTGTYHASQKTELVIFVTPHIVEAGEPSMKYLEPLENGKSALNAHVPAGHPGLIPPSPP